MRKLLIARLLALSLLAMAEASAEVQALTNSKAPAFSLLDQYDQPYDLRQAEGRTVILLASDGKGAKHNRQWVDAIKGRYRDPIVIVGIADTRGVPFFMKSAVKNKFKKSPAPVFLDWNGVVFTSYGLAPRVSNLVLIDKQGIVQFLISGEATPAACEKLFREIDKLER
jgi:predicted transcriptional regulator